MNLINRIKDFNERVREKIGWKIIDSYLLWKMLGTVVFAITLLMTVVVVFDMSENIQRFMSHNVPWKEVITGYYFNFIPYFINLFIPLFTFISVIWFTSKLSTRNEIISIFDNGISFNRMLVPYVTGAVIIMILSLILANFIVPTTNRKMNELSLATQLPAAQLAVLAAVNATEDMMKSRDELTRLRREMDALKDENERLRFELEAKDREIARLKASDEQA